MSDSLWSRDGQNAEEEVMQQLRTSLESKGLELYPFKIGWYNAKVETAYQFHLHEDTLAVLVISTPSMFEKLFLPYVMGDSYISGTVDPLDRCIRKTMDSVTTIFPQYRVEFIQDSELMPNRRPKVLVQTAGHIAGAAYYYQRTDVNPQQWSTASPIYGVSIHPNYGGWFALRGILIVPGVLVPNLVQHEPIDCVYSPEKRVELLDKFNTCWQDWSYKDVIERGMIVERYSKKQKEYFATIPKDRFKLIQKWRKEIQDE